MALALFDLDHTLIDGDTDVLWCDFLIDQGRVDGTTFRARNADMEQRYRAGTVSAREFCGFFVSTLAGYARDDLDQLRARFHASRIAPRICRGTRPLIEMHRQRGDLLVMTTATNHYLVEPIARVLDIPHLIATLPDELDGLFTGQTTGVLNMREGKVERLTEWLRARRLDVESELAGATFYSDSANDLPLLEAVGQPVAVDAEPRLAAVAANRGWRTMTLRG